MGWGDDIIATGYARGARERGKRIAFGDGHRIIWGPHSEEVFRNNLNVARPGTELNGDVEWVNFHKGNRHYNRLVDSRWMWNYDFRPKPGEIFFDQQELAFANSFVDGFVFMEPNAPVKGRINPNKQWPHDRWQHVADWLIKRGFRIVQTEHSVYGGTRQRLLGATIVPTRTFRIALAVMSRADLVIVHEGGLHHGAAALGKKAVVIFGGWVPPEVTGYDMHVNLASGGKACGSRFECEHCRQALRNITVEQVVGAVDVSRNLPVG